MISLNKYPADAGVPSTSRVHTVDGRGFATSWHRTTASGAEEWLDESAVRALLGATRAPQPPTVVPQPAATVATVERDVAALEEALLGGLVDLALHYDASEVLVEVDGRFGGQFASALEDRLVAAGFSRDGYGELVHPDSFELDRQVA